MMRLTLALLAIFGASFDPQTALILAILAVAYRPKESPHA